MVSEKDSDGEIIVAGDLVRFSYGIPPVGVVARVIERNGKLYAITPQHSPRECRIDHLRKYVGSLYKAMPLQGEAAEIEARILKGRFAASQQGEE